MKYQIVDWYDKDEWQDYLGSYQTPCWVAKDVANDHYNQDPCDPSCFEPTIRVKDESGKISTFKISARFSVDFYADEVKND